MFDMGGGRYPTVGKARISRSREEAPGPHSSRRILSHNGERIERRGLRGKPC